MKIDEFLLARITEDEECARSAKERVYVCGGGCLSTPVDQWADGSDRLPNHHNVWWLVYDPARVLAECAAKRVIIEEAWEQYLNFLFEYGSPSTRDALTQKGHYPQVLRLMVQPYAEHDDFDPAWGSDG